jgi:hypothetical protein
MGTGDATGAIAVRTNVKLRVLHESQKGASGPANESIRDPYQDGNDNSSGYFPHFGVRSFLGAKRNNVLHGFNGAISI